MVRAKNVELAYIKEQSGDIVIGQSADFRVFNGHEAYRQGGRWLDFH